MMTSPCNERSLLNNGGKINRQRLAEKAAIAQPAEQTVFPLLPLAYTRRPRSIIMTRGVLLRLAPVLLLAALPAVAHHSFGAEYDANKPITLSGIVTKVEWSNPHSYFFLDVQDANGNVANWKFEGYPPTVLYRTGWKRNVTMKPGDAITVFGWRARDGTNWAHSREVTFSDGKKLFFGPPAGTGDGGNTPAVDAK
jgi:hypothetical protein